LPESQKSCPLVILLSEKRRKSSDLLYNFRFIKPIVQYWNGKFSQKNINRGDYCDKTEKIKKGDKIAIVSLSWGGLGDAKLIHKYDIAKERLERDFGLNVVAMPHALRGSEFVYAHPELRAKDLMDAYDSKSLVVIASINHKNECDFKSKL
jgi:hypothetical protein